MAGVYLWEKVAVMARLSRWLECKVDKSSAQLLFMHAISV